MYLHFRADGDKDRKGFKITWRAITPIKMSPGDTKQSTVATITTAVITDMTLKGKQGTSLFLCCVLYFFPILLLVKTECSILNECIEV